MDLLEKLMKQMTDDNLQTIIQDSNSYTKIREGNIFWGAEINKKKRKATHRDTTFYFFQVDNTEPTSEDFFFTFSDIKSHTLFF